MEEIKSVILVLLIGFVFGFLLGTISIKEVVNSDCEKYGSYANSKYKMTCEARK